MRNICVFISADEDTELQEVLSLTPQAQVFMRAMWLRSSFSSANCSTSKVEHMSQIDYILNSKGKWVRWTESGREREEREDGQRESVLRKGAESSSRKLGESTLCSHLLQWLIDSQHPGLILIILGDVSLPREMHHFSSFLIIPASNCSCLLLWEAQTGVP